MASLSGLLATNNKAWANLYLNSLKVFNDVEIDGDLTLLGGIATDNIVADNITVNDILLIEPTATIDGNPEFTGDIKAQGFEPVQHANQDILRRVKHLSESVAFNGSVLSGGTQNNTISFSRIGRSVLCEIHDMTFGPGGSDSLITVDLSGFTGYSDNFEPNRHVFAIVPVKNPALNNPLIKMKI